MTVKTKVIKRQRYAAPDAVVCGLLADAIICDSLTSGAIEDWVDDGNSFGDF